MIVVSNRGEGPLRGIIVGSLAPKLLHVGDGARAGGFRRTSAVIH